VTLPRPMSLVADDDSDDEFAPPRDPVNVAADQVCDALIALQRPAHHYLRMPWPSLNALVGGIQPGAVWFLGGFSGNGKTTLLMTLLDLLYEGGKRVYYMGLESAPMELRTTWSALRLGILPGDALTGEIHLQPNGPALQTALEQDLKDQVHDHRAKKVYISPEEFIDVQRLGHAVEEAKEFGAEVFIVDHIDHIEGGEGTNLYAESVRTVKRVLKLAQKYRIPMLVATQFNNEAANGHPMAVYRPPQPGHVFMGGHKRQVASGMLGLYRPMRLSGVSEDELKAVASGRLEAWKILEPNTMGVVVMKHRAYGSRERKSCLLRVENGRCVEPGSLDYAGAQHGIATNRDIMTPYGGK
jgi:KaiC/GvpD/RAD55 family RecA-like ATPase